RISVIRDRMMIAQVTLFHEVTMSRTSNPQAPPSSSHHADSAPHPDAGPATDHGRGPDGRFCKGNKGGPGNPYARQVAALRQAFLAAVTGEDIANIAKVMIEKAKQGDAAVTKRDQTERRAANEQDD